MQSQSRHGDVGGISLSRTGLDSMSERSFVLNENRQGCNDESPARSVPEFSVIIAAHNEEKVLSRCLDALLADSRPGEMEIILAANGCTDSTVEIGRGYGNSVRVVEISQASKPAALNAGDAAATVFPRVYLDADITVSGAALRAVVDELERTGALAGAPQAVIDFYGCPAVVRSFYRVWCESPWFTNNMVGSGLYVLSAAGHARLGVFPDLLNEDQYVSGLFAIHERLSVKSHQFVLRPPRSVDALVRHRARTLVGQRELDQRFGPLPGRSPRLSPADLLRRQPARIVDLLVFTAVTMLAKRAAARKELRGDHRWERDETSRVISS
jgi:hypothetical protein